MLGTGCTGQVHSGYTLCKIITVPGEIQALLFTIFRHRVTMILRVTVRQHFNNQGMFNPRKKPVIFWNKWQNYFPWINKDISYCCKAFYNLCREISQVAHKELQKIDHRNNPRINCLNKALKIFPLLL